MIESHTHLFVYHRCPPEMQGSTLYPMNKMPEILSSFKTSAAKKYSWRSEVMEGVVPVIECLWNDAIHCSPYHPRELYRAQQLAGVTSMSTTDLFFEIPLPLVLEQPTAVYMYEHVANEVQIGMHVTGEGSRGVVFLDDEQHTHHEFAALQMVPGSNDYFRDPSQFLPCSPTLMRDIIARGVPVATTSYYRRCAALDCQPLTFFHVPHVLVKGELSVAGCRVVKWCDDEI